MDRKHIDMNPNRKRAIKAFLDPANETIADVAEAIGLHVNTVLKYTGEEDFIKILVDAKKALKRVE